MFSSFSRKMKIWETFIALFLCMVVFVGSFAALRFVPNSRYALLRNPFVQSFLHTYRSFNRISNIAFFPYWFRSSNLAQYELALSPKDILRLNEHLPQDPIDGQKLDADAFDVKGDFVADGYAEKVKVRYRGKTANHWNAEQRSFRVQFPKDKLFHGMRTLHFVVPYDRQYFVEPLNMYRAKKFGLRALDMSFAELKVKGKSSGGVYLVFEGLNKEWLSRNKGADEFLLFGVKDDVRQEPGINPPMLLSEEGRARWEVINNKDALAGNSEELQSLITLLAHSDDATFEKLAPYLIDLNSFYGWEMVQVLAASGHQDDYWNLVLLFNTHTGRFEMVPWDVETDMDSRYVDSLLKNPATLIARRVLSIPAFRKEFASRLKAYVSDQKNLEDDLRFYDGLFEKTKVGFLKDNSKLFSTFAFLNQVRGYRHALESHFLRAREALAQYGDPPASFDAVISAAPPSFGGIFKNFNDLGSSVPEFLARYPQFYSPDGATLELPPGTYSFRTTVLIPAGLKVKINPGTTMYLGAGASFISYSPVDARGIALAPIRVRSFYPAAPFGVFAVVNTEAKRNVFDYFSVENGSEARVNGIVFSGMMSIHNSEAEINHARFAHSQGPDALHIARSGDIRVSNSHFEYNRDDNIDFDFVRGAVTASLFYDPGSDENGDAIDLSGSAADITDNVIRDCGDKGFSIGEESRFVHIRRNIVMNCSIGAAVKDLSEASFRDNFFLFNNNALEVYQKKAIFGGGTALVGHDIWWGNKRNIKIDDKSKLIVLDSVTEGGVAKGADAETDAFVKYTKTGGSIAFGSATQRGDVAGRGNMDIKPDFQHLLPASIYEAIKDKL